MLLGMVLLGGLVGCATPPPASDPEAVADYNETNDPLEPTNRAVYAFDDALDTVIMQPAAQAYRFLLPQPVRTGVHNVLNNLGDASRSSATTSWKPSLAGPATRPCAS